MKKSMRCVTTTLILMQIATAQMPGSLAQYMNLPVTSAGLMDSNRVVTTDKTQNIWGVKKFLGPINIGDGVGGTPDVVFHDPALSTTVTFRLPTASSNRILTIPDVTGILATTSGGQDFTNVGAITSSGTASASSLTLLTLTNLGSAAHSSSRLILSNSVAAGTASNGNDILWQGASGANLGQIVVNNNGSGGTSMIFGTRTNAGSLIDRITIDQAGNLTSIASLISQGGTTGDKILISGQSAGSGALMYVANAAGNAYEPLLIDAETHTWRIDGNPAKQMLMSNAGNVTLTNSLVVGGIISIGETVTVTDGTQLYWYVGNGTTAAAGYFFSDVLWNGGSPYLRIVKGTGGETEILTLDGSGNLNLDGQVSSLGGQLRAQGYNAVAGDGVVFFGDDANDYIFSQTNAMMFRVNGSDRLTISSDGYSTFSSGVAAAGRIITTGNTTGNLTSSIRMDYATGGRIIVQGPNATTRSGFDLILTEDDGGGSITPIGVDNSGNITFIGLLTKPGGTTPLITTNTAITDGAGAQVATLTNAPAAGNPTKWVPIDDNGTTRYIPTW